MILKNHFRLLHFMVVWFLAGLTPAIAQWSFDLESGVAFSGYNNVRIPGKGGTKISLSEELKTDPAFFFRFKALYRLSLRSELILLVAPFRVNAEGRVSRPVTFQETTFPADTPLHSRFRFDSYRVTYRYEFYHKETVRACIGLTAKIRDASISLEGSNIKSEKKNTGFVPLVNFLYQWNLARDLSLVIDGDALASPKGRAEDVLIAALYQRSDKLSFKLGYRILEGGADNDRVYNFTLIHYLVAGIGLAF